MTAYTGRKVAVGIWKETTRGTAVAPAIYYAHTEFNPQDKVEYVEHEGVIGTLAKTHKKEVAQKYAESPLKGLIGVDSVGFFLLALLWSVASAETSWGGAYEHNFTLLNDNIHPTFTLVEKNGVEGLAYPMSAIEKLSIDFAQGKFIEIDSSWKSKFSIPMTLTPNYIDEENFLARQVEVSFADDVAGLDGATPICVESGNLELSKEIEQVFCLWEIEPQEVLVKAVDFQGSLTITHKDNTFTGYYKNGTRKAMRIKMINPNKTIGTEDKPTIIFDIPQVSFDDVVKEGGKDDIIKQNITVSGLFDINSGNLITGKVINTTNTY